MKTKLLAIAVVYLFWGLSQGLLAAELEVYVAAKKMPTELQGPFTHIDGGILCVEKNQVHRSFDGGITWNSKPLFDSESYADRDERAILRTKEGTIIFAFLNEKELQTGPEGWGKGDVNDWVLPVYTVRSTDNGETWSSPLQLQRRWCGAIRSIIQLENGRIVLVSSIVIPWIHAVQIYTSDDQGQSWQTRDILTIKGNGDHDGAMEATIVERADHSVFMLVRTTKGTFFQSVSTDDGMTWSEPVSSGIQSSTCCGMMTRLSDGRISLLWNRVQCDTPYDYPPDAPVYSSRQELSIAFSEDDAKTWSEPLVVAARHASEGDTNNQVSYPYLFEATPGIFWITSMYGGLRISVDEPSLLTETTKCSEEKDSISDWKNIVLFGDSTTAFRTGVVTYGEQLEKRLKEEQLAANVVNSGVPGSTTADARVNFDNLVREKNPDLVVVQFGINDAAIDVWADPPATEPRVSKELFEDNLKWIVQQIKEMDIPLVLMTTTQLRWSDKTKELYGKAPYNPSDPKSFNEVMLRDYNQTIRDVASSEHVPLVDIFTVWDEIAETKGEEGIMALLLNDAMHPGTNGHRLLFDRLYPVIKQTLELKTCRRTVPLPLKVFDKD